MGSSGPGHIHLVNGLYDANKAGEPYVAIVLTIPTEKMGLDNLLKVMDRRGPGDVPHRAVIHQKK